MFQNAFDVDRPECRKTIRDTLSFRQQLRERSKFLAAVKIFSAAVKLVRERKRSRVEKVFGNFRERIFYLSKRRVVYFGCKSIVHACYASEWLDVHSVCIKRSRAALARPKPHFHSRGTPLPLTSAPLLPFRSLSCLVILRLLHEAGAHVLVQTDTMHPRYFVFRHESRVDERRTFQFFR